MFISNYVQASLSKTFFEIWNPKIMCSHICNMQSNLNLTFSDAPLYIIAKHFPVNTYTFSLTTDKAYKGSQQRRYEGGVI